MQASPVMFAAAPGSSPISRRSGITLSDAKGKENAHTAARFDTLRLATLGGALWTTVRCLIPG
jgi:hypothetical protein